MSTDSYYEADLERVDAAILDNKSFIADREGLEVLFKDKNFKKFILEEVLTAEVDKLTTSLAMDAHDKDSEELVLVRLRSLKMLRGFINSKLSDLTRARDTLIKDEQFRKDLINNANSGDYE